MLLSLHKCSSVSENGTLSDSIYNTPSYKQFSGSPTDFVSQKRGRSESFLMIYSISNQNKLNMEIDPRLVKNLQAPQKPVKRRPSVRRSTRGLDGSSTSLAARSSSTKKPAKKVRFADKVLIHRISVHKNTAAPLPETFRLIVSLRQIWKELDLDKDKYLNMAELKRFVCEMWDGEDSEEMMKNYAKDPKKGMDFGDWCALLREEDPDLNDLIDDMYDIFLEESESDDDEKNSISSDSQAEL